MCVVIAEMRNLFLVFFICIAFFAQGQSVLLTGKVSDNDGKPLEEAIVIIKNTNSSTATDVKGQFKLSVDTPGDYTIIIFLIGYQKIEKSITLKGGSNTIDYKLIATDKILNQVDIVDQSEKDGGIMSIDPKAIKYFPSAFGDFNKVLATMPGVVANNELSSAYTVRGGNFDENQVYVNDMQVYRPFLVPAGQQEGLSFINPNLVSGVEFQAGGWNAVYGDKLSSVLNVKYKEPKKFAGSATLSMLGASAHLESGSKDGRFSAVVGGRYKNSKYLLGTLPVKGQYFPRFFDLQSYFKYDLTRKSSVQRNKTTLGLLFYYANNSYYSKPETSQISFGTLDRPMTFNVAFDGSETMNYNTFQSGLKLNHVFSSKFKSTVIGSFMTTREREYTDLESGYRLCDVSLDPGDPNSANKCATIAGLGTIYNYSRNLLDAQVITLENRNTWILSDKVDVEVGARYSYESIQDKVAEYTFTDSAGFIRPHDIKGLSSKNELNSNRFSGYVQTSIVPDSIHKIVLGIRTGYWDVNQEVLFGPRIQYFLKPAWVRNWQFRLATGIYQQPAFYRELRDSSGALNKNIKAQTSYQVIAGTDYKFKGWDRPFKLSMEGYYKYIEHVIPYDIINQKIRYYPNKTGTAYATGVDFRLSGEFAKGEESWFSLGVMSTKEDIVGDGKGYIRRPSDQRVTVGIYFQDHIPNYPSIKVYLNMIYGTGLPFGPPNEPAYRNSFNGPAYRRVDIGFSKLLTFNEPGTRTSKMFRSVWIGLEVLNLLGINNTMAYVWVKDYSNNNYAVPLTLSQRFVNFKLVVYF